MRVCDPAVLLHLPLCREVESQNGHQRKPVFSLQALVLRMMKNEFNRAVVGNEASVVY